MAVIVGSDETPAVSMPLPPPQPSPGTASRAGSVSPAKIRPPGLPAVSVRRRTIADRIEDAVHVRLVLVRAPAGFGKTTAMQQLRERLEARGSATAWLTLDRADNDLPRLLACLAAAVQTLGIEASPAHGDDLVEQLARHESPFTLLLDDVESLKAPAAFGLLRELLERLPRGGRLVLGSRTLPDLALGRLRARGQLLEIDAALLRFSAAETDEFFRLRGAPLAPRALDRLHRTTEGWIAALWLVSVAMERRPGGITLVDGVAEAAGSSDGAAQAIADYLAEDVLAQQPPEVRDFLLRTSILRTLDPDVCAAVAPRSDPAAMLRRLEAANLFIASVAGEPSGWRYHSLFGRFLRQRLASERPEDVARLHLAASGWYEAQGRRVPAIDHAIEGGDAPHALHLLAGQAESFLQQGRMRLLDRWFCALPAERLAQHPRLRAIALWAECFTRGPEPAMASLERSGLVGSDDPEVAAHVGALRPMLLAMADRHDEAYALGRSALAGLPTGHAFPDGVLANVMAYVVSVLGERHEAHRLLDAARRSQRGSTFNRMYTESTEGVLDMAEGRLREAAARFRMAVGAAADLHPGAASGAPIGSGSRAASWNPGSGNAWAGVLYVATVYEADDLRAADRLLNIYLPVARDVGLPDHMIASHRMRARIAFAEGDVDAAFRTLAELEYLGHDRRLPRVSACAKLERARMLVLQGHPAAARDELQRADDPALWSRVRELRLYACEVDDLPIGRWRWEVHHGDAAGAAAGLQAAALEADRAGRRHRALKLRTLGALAQARAGRGGAEGVETLAEVVRTTAVEGFMRLLLDEGPALAPLLRQLRAATAEDGPVVADHVRRLLFAFGAEPAPDESEPAPVLLADPLTRKELRALQLLAEGYSNGAMAEKLFVSDSTVRTHLRNINLKLGAKSRTQALAIARRGGLLA